MANWLRDCDHQEDWGWILGLTTVVRTRWKRPPLQLCPSLWTGGHHDKSRWRGNDKTHENVPSMSTRDIYQLYFQVNRQTITDARKASTMNNYDSSFGKKESNNKEWFTDKHELTQWVSEQAGGVTKTECGVPLLSAPTFNQKNRNFPWAARNAQGNFDSTSIVKKH